MGSYHAAVWLDHHEARIFHIGLDDADEATLRAPKQHLHRHPKGPTAEHEHPDDLHHFFRDLARALQGAQEILVGGPSTAKTQFLAYVHEHDSELEHRIVKVEALDHPTDAQLVAHARHHFKLDRPRV
ncbi:MAG: translational machinery protein [Polyangiaceae bacterium]